MSVHRWNSSTLIPLLLAFLIAPNAFPAVLSSIVIDGNTVMTSRELLALMSSRVSFPYSDVVAQNDLRTIAEAYRMRGYLRCTVDRVETRFSDDSAFVDLVLHITEGRRTVLGSVLPNGQRELSAADILSQFDMRPGMPLDEQLLERDVDALLARYEKLGFPFAECRVVGMTTRPGEGDDLLDVSLAIEEGQRVTIDEITVEGNKETDASVVVRETRLTPGEPYNPAKVDAIRQRLRRLNIFADVAEPELYLRRQRGGLLITVQEGRTNTFDGMVGYIPQNTAGQGGYVTGLVSVGMRNLLGTGRKFSVRWQKEDRYSQELALRYVEPWVAGLPVNVGGGFFQRKQDTSYVRRAFDLKGELMLSEELSVGLLFGSESVIPSSDSTVNRALRSSTTTIGADVLYDTRDDIYSPTSGVRYRADYSYGRKKIDPGANRFQGHSAGDASIQRLQLDLDLFLPTVSRQVFAVGVHGRELRSGQLEESEMYRFGGANTLRGYRENQFLASRAVWSNCEYRFVLARRSFFYGFVDLAYYYRPADEQRGAQQVKAFRHGYGLGIRLDTSLGNLGVSFALGQGDSFGQAKVHVGLINDF